MAQQPRTVAENRRARYDFHLDEIYDAGVVLVGSEVKSLRDGRASIQDSYAAEQNGEIWLINCHIPEYHGANRFNHEPRRQRKLLLKRKEISSEEHTSELQSLMRISYAVFCLKKKTT